MEDQIEIEKLYFYYISLSTGLISLDDYEENLNDLFLADDGQNDIFLELQLCTGNLEKTITALNIYLFDKIVKLDFQAFGEILINELRKQYTYNPNTLKKLTHILYSIWTLLPSEVSEKEPFIKLNSIDDSWSWGGKEKVIEDVNRLLNYYN